MGLPPNLITGRKAVLPDDIPKRARPTIDRWAVYRLGRRPRKEMNKTEAAFERDVLAVWKLAGEVLDWWFNDLRFQVTHTTQDGKPGIVYTPDYMVLTPDGHHDFYEVKGSGKIPLDSRNRLKAAAEKFYSIRFVLAQKQAGGGFTFENF